MAVVVFPTPPFWLAIATIFIFQVKAEPVRVRLDGQHARFLRPAKDKKTMFFKRVIALEVQYGNLPEQNA